MMVYDTVSKRPVLIPEHSSHLAMTVVAQGGVLSIGVALALIVYVNDTDTRAAV